MTTAPEPYLSACLTVLERAILWCRAASWGNRWSTEHVADLMDAVHNIPSLIHNWELCDIPLLRESFLKAYEKKWLDRGGLALCQIFDAVVASDGANAESDA